MPDTLVDTDVLRAAVQLACRAPSLHNSQPWHWVAEDAGLSVVRSLVGHGIGRSMHEEPQIPNYGEPGRGPKLEEGMVLVSRSRIASGVASDWHHHGRRRLFGVLLAGRLRLEYGPQGKEAVDLEPGDFFRIPVGLVHRDVNPDAKREAIVAAFLEGEGAPAVNVAGPEGGV